MNGLLKYVVYYCPSLVTVLRGSESSLVQNITVVKVDIRMTRMLPYRSMTSIKVILLVIKHLGELQMASSPGSISLNPLLF